MSRLPYEMSIYEKTKLGQFLVISTTDRMPNRIHQSREDAVP